MKIDFLKNTCAQAPVTVQEFGLCDNEHSEKAFADLINRDGWIAVVQNPSMTEVIVTAVDNCLIRAGELSGVKRCDLMLHTSGGLYFVELKNQARYWIPEAVEQLKSTIQLFYQNHPSAFFRYKKAFACNKKHPHFQEIDNELNLRFFRETGFRLDVQAKVVVLP